MSQKSEVVSIYKPLGKSMGELVDSFRLEGGIGADIPITYAGRLDPMAEGLAILLVGDAVHHKDEYLGLSKEYTFECLWGFETDTYDILGLVQNGNLFEEREISFEETSQVAKTLVGKRTQEYPAYSSKPVQGKPLFMWAREGKLDTIHIPTHEVEIFEIAALSHKTISGKDLLDEIDKKVSLVHGDFRQSHIIQVWQDSLLHLMNTTFYISTLHARVSSGAYIRTLVHEMGKQAGTHATTFHIVRKKIGEFSL